MSETIGRPGDWAEVRFVLLPPAERAIGLPEDTAGAPLEARVKGFLEHEARVGDAATVATALGRRIDGTLLRILPESGHSFGRPVPELLPIGGELRRLLQANESDA